MIIKIKWTSEVMEKVEYNLKGAQERAAGGAAARRWHLNWSAASAGNATFMQRCEQPQNEDEQSASRRDVTRCTKHSLRISETWWRRLPEGDVECCNSKARRRREVRAAGGGSTLSVIWCRGGDRIRLCAVVRVRDSVLPCRELEFQRAEGLGE